MTGDDAIKRLVSLQSLVDLVTKRRKAIALCIASSLPVEALVLMYVTMDNFASLDRAADHATVSRADFLHWVDTYLLPESGLSCSAADLWGARCGLVHDYSPQSNWTRDGRASQILYVWGKRTEEDLQGLIEDTHAKEVPNDPRPHAVHVEHLFAALSQGIQRFVREVRADRTRERQVLAHAQQLFSLLPGSEWGSDTL